MTIELTPNKTVREIKKQFQQQFPYLTLRFYHYRHGTAESSMLDEPLKDSAALQEATWQLTEGEVTIDGRDSVAQFEQKLGSMGLPVQVLRCFKNVWIETKETDHLTLEQQNEMGKNASE